MPEKKHRKNTGNYIWTFAANKKARTALTVLIHTDHDCFDPDVSTAETAAL